MSAPRNGWTLLVTGTCAIPDSWRDHIYMHFYNSPLDGPTCPLPSPRSPGTPSRWGAAKRSCARCAWLRCDAPWFSRHQQTARHSGRRSFTSVSHSTQACSHVPHNTLERNFPGVTGPGTVTPRYSATPPGRMTTSVAWPRAASVTPYHHLRETRRGSGAYSFTPLRGDELT